MKKLIRHIRFAAKVIFAGLLMGAAGIASAYTHNYDMDPDLALTGTSAGGYIYTAGYSFDDVYTFTTSVPNVAIDSTITWNPNTTTILSSSLYYGTPGSGFLVASGVPIPGFLYSGVLSIAGSWYIEETGSIVAGKKGGGYAATFDVTVPSPVPEPGEWAMMLSGLGLIGVLARRRRKNATLLTTSFTA